MRLCELNFSSTFSKKVDSLVNTPSIRHLNEEDLNVIYELFRSGKLLPNDKFWLKLIKNKSNTLAFLHYISKRNKLSNNKELLNYLKKNNLDVLYRLVLNVDSMKRGDVNGRETRGK